MIGKLKTDKIYEIDVNDIMKKYEETSSNARINDSFKSWEHCINAFRRAASKRYGISDFIYRENCCNGCMEKCNITSCRFCDKHLALNLAFYLASWGMYRGSSFLRKYDYTIHIGAVKILMDEVYLPLFDNCFCIKRTNEYVELTARVFVELWEYYEKYANNILNKKGNKMHVSDTLITKIILGVYGCMPAYDRYFKKGVGHFGGIQNLNPKNIKEALEEIVEIAKCWRCKIVAVLNGSVTTWNKGSIYTRMRILDMIIWKIGEELP